jgi:hypothetical protein
MMFCPADYQLIVGQLYKLGLDNILKRCVLNHKRHDIPWEFHNGVAGGHVLHIIFVIPMTVNDVNLFFSFRGVSGLSS